MLIQLIYRSRSRHSFTPQALAQMSDEFTARNIVREVSGLLLYDGEYFLQVLEGHADTVSTVYAAVCADARHSDIVLLLQDPIPHTHFKQFRVDILDVRESKGLSDRDKWFHWSTLLGLNEQRDQRSVRIIEAFVRGRWRDAVHAVGWYHDGYSRQRPTQIPSPPLDKHSSSQAFARFALQPIVHSKAQCITSVEALLRGPNGESPQAVLNALPASQLHDYDLRSKGEAIALAAALKLDCVLSVNLLPMSLVANKGAVSYLVEQCAIHRWPIEKLLVEVTEEEAITHFGSFFSAVQELRAAGIQVAIDDFGAGHAGLSLLADFQPDKLKIDKRIIQGVHSSGPRQAIVRSVLEFCFCLGISVVAEGVETVEDWWWLQSAGVRRFQGYLFARPTLQGVTPVVWPAAPWASPEGGLGSDMR